MKDIKRRTFVKSAGVVAAALSLGCTGAVKQEKKLAVSPNSAPRWRGFNLLDLFSPNPESRTFTTEDDFKWISDWGFDFVRFPMAYPRYLNFDRTKDITPDDMLNFNEAEIEKVDRLVNLAGKHGLHISLNLHRAPGFCVNAGFNEPFNLWKDEEAQEAFYAHWGMWAKRYKDLTSKQISFDLVNEPCEREDMNDQYSQRSAIAGETYRKVAKMASETIRAYNPNHMVVADGNDVGSKVIPEITDLNIIQSCRGYFPHYISHYRAPWVYENPDDAPTPVWPGEIDGQQFSRDSLMEVFQPWIDLVKSGVGVHCGECGCWKETPHEVFLAWFGDVLDILTSNGIGYALWNFRGDFGILDSGRTDVDYVDWHGHKLDKKLLELLQKN